ncbi:MAG: response regulator transcription factor [Sphingobacteriales bacterium]|jgi:two-component system alkaline phosphatase synthesis response regulator PhoP|nr:response regulator transcription factor [Sphingobacteriales bacterium]
MSNEIKILIADDEPDILEFVKYNLEKEGYQVFTAENGNDALQIAQTNLPHLIILDIMMPELDGMQACKALRNDARFSETLIIFLTARNEEFTQVVALDLGADDYIAKPIRPRLLVSKVKSLLRRYTTDEPEQEIQRIADLEIDREKFMVRRGDESIDLPKKEFNLLYLLASKPGKVFGREEILARIWGDDVIVNDRTIDVHIRKIREKLGEHYIKTIKGIGYKFDL